MIALTVPLPQRSWLVRVYIAYQPSDVPEICHSLASIGCNQEALAEARHHLSGSSNDKGLTYSNLAERISVVAVGQSLHQSGTINTLSHELLHVVSHICERDGINMHSEEPCYMLGTLFEYISQLISEHSFAAQLSPPC